MTRLATAVLLAALVALLGGGVGAQAPPPVSALVLEATGTSRPAVQPYSEVRAGTTFELGSGAKLVLFHYHTCRTLGLTGGKVTVNADGFAPSGGSTTLDERRPCPRRVNVGGEAGGAVLRGAGQGPTMSTRPTFVLLGPRAEDFATVRVTREKALVLEAPLATRRFEWPAGTAALAAGALYELTLVPRASGSEATFAFTATAAGDPAGELPVLVTVK
jgi:hypothetical protein